MSYEKQTWAKGDIVTSAKLNHMEDGIASGGGSIIVHETYDESTGKGTLDKTWQQIFDALSNSDVVIVRDGETSHMRDYVCGAYSDREIYYVTTTYTETHKLNGYSADSANGYPSIEGD